MQFNNFPPGAASVGYGPPVSVTYIDHSGSSSNPSNPVTLSGVSLGTATTYRWIVLILHWEQNSGTAGIDSITLGGQSPDHQIDSLNGDMGTVIAAFSYPTGTTANIVVDFSNTDVGRMEVGRWNITKDKPLDLYASDTDNTLGTATITASPFCPAGSVCIAGATSEWSMSSYTGLATEDYSDSIAGDVSTHAKGSSEAFTVSETPSITAQRSGGGSITIAAASFR